jgi:hypothetical protein
MAEGYKKERKSINLAGVSSVAGVPGGGRRKQETRGHGPDSAADEAASKRTTSAPSRANARTTRRSRRP